MTSRYCSWKGNHDIHPCWAGSVWKFFGRSRVSSQFFFLPCHMNDGYCIDILSRIYHLTFSCKIPFFRIELHFSCLARFLLEINRIRVCQNASNDDPFSGLNRDFSCREGNTWARHRRLNSQDWFFHPLLWITLRNPRPNTIRSLLAEYLWSFCPRKFLEGISKTVPASLQGSSWSGWSSLLECVFPEDR